ncbi:MAG: GNAT family N-acetyltransferase [Devosia sp.]
MLTPPELLGETHILDDFSCGKPALDDWLLRRARNNQENGASRTYVVTDEDRVVGFYSLSSGAVATTDAPGALRRNMPDPIPMALLGRLAVDRRRQGQGIGPGLLRDAILRTAQAAAILGIRGIVVHALDEEARAFYLNGGFVSSPTQPLTLFLSMKGMAARPAPRA